MVKSVLIIGGSGFVGTHLALRLREGHKVIATYFTHRISIPGVTMVPMNVDNRHWIKQVMTAMKPDVVVYVPGENAPARDYRGIERIHVAGAANILSASEMIQPKVIYLSSCYAFDGVRGNYRETDPALPTLPHGKAKVSGENFVRGRSMHSIIVRCSPLFGRGNGFHLSLLDRLRMGLDRGMTIEANGREIHSYAPVEGLADLISELISKPPVKTKILHYGGLTKLSQADFMKAFASRFGYDPRLIINKSGQESPLDYSLNSSHAVETLKIKPLLLEEGFDLIEKQLITHA